MGSSRINDCLCACQFDSYVIDKFTHFKNDNCVEMTVFKVMPLYFSICQMSLFRATQGDLNVHQTSSCMHWSELAYRFSNWISRRVSENDHTIMNRGKQRFMEISVKLSLCSSTLEYMYSSRHICHRQHVNKCYAIKSSSNNETVESIQTTQFTEQIFSVRNTFGSV